MDEKKLKSGAVLRMQLASLEEADELLSAVLSELIGVNLKVNSFEELKSLELSAIKDAIFKVLASRRVKDAIWACLASCTYQPASEKAGIRIDRSTFASAQSRPDYFPVAGEVAVYNLSPFFKNLELPSSIQSVAANLGTSPGPSTG